MTNRQFRLHSALDEDDVGGMKKTRIKVMKNICVVQGCLKTTEWLKCHSCLMWAYTSVQTI